ncbi:MAG: DUF3703 domain-containing protein [Alcanivorax sp.]|nr:DUF3703 domain-containing protein [Alcanivorax sp.]
MRAELAAAFREEMKKARAARANGDIKACLKYLERAHVLGQRNLWPHILTHAWMLRVGWRQRDYREVFGQILRLAATVPGALTGWVPAGNTGRANVSALRRMPIPAEFRPYFADQSMLRSVLIRLSAIALLVVLAITGTNILAAV